MSDKLTREEIEEGIMKVFSDPNSKFVKMILEDIEKRKELKK